MLHDHKLAGLCDLLLLWKGMEVPLSFFEIAVNNRFAVDKL